MIIMRCFITTFTSIHLVFSSNLKFPSQEFWFLNPFLKFKFVKLKLSFRILNFQMKVFQLSEINFLLPHSKFLNHITPLVPFEWVLFVSKLQLKDSILDCSELNFRFQVFILTILSRSQITLIPMPIVVST